MSIEEPPVATAKSQNSLEQITERCEIEVGKANAT